MSSIQDNENTKKRMELNMTDDVSTVTSSVFRTKDSVTSVSEKTGEDDDLIMIIKERTRVRDLRADDFEHGVLDLLAQLTIVGKVSKDEFNNRFEVLSKDSNQKIIVLEDAATSQLLAYGSICVEPKFIHQAGFAGHIEDVVVDQKYRSQGFGSLIVRHLIAFAKARGCYKVILDCKKRNVGFYEKLGFYRKEVQMALYFSDTDRSDTTGVFDLKRCMNEKETCGESLTVRQLSEDDLDSGGFLELLGQLTTVGSVEPAFLKKRLELLRASNRNLMFVIEDCRTSRVVAAATLLVEYKFIHHCGYVGRT